MISARSSNEYLSRDEFYIALKLVAYEQNGIRGDENALELNIDVGNPRFDDDILKKPQV